MLELDLIGRKITLTESDAQLLLSAAEASSGSSIGSRDLATRLKDISFSAPQRRRRLVFSRPETRALQRIVQSRFEPGGLLDDLQYMLSEVLSTEEPLPEPERD